jgi:hypothetical protein
MTDQPQPKPLSANELKLLESKAGVTGLSTVDVRRLLANNARLRQLVLDAAKLLTPNSEVSSEQAREIYDEIKDEVKR